MAKCVRRHNCGSVGAGASCTQFDPTLVHHPAWDEKYFIHFVVYDVVPRAQAAKRRCRVIRSRWSWRTTAQQFRGETPDLALVLAVIAFAARLRACRRTRTPLGIMNGGEGLSASPGRHMTQTLKRSNEVENIWRRPPEALTCGERQSWDA